MITQKHYYIVVLMFTFDQHTGNLSPGVHTAPWRDIQLRFAGNRRRARLFEGLRSACRNLAAAGCVELLLDGSFVTRKRHPRDYDCAWGTAGVDPDLLDPVLLDFSNGRAAMKAKYFGDLFPASALAAPDVLYRDFFKTDRNGVEKGIVLINLRYLP